MVFSFDKKFIFEHATTRQWVHKYRHIYLFKELLFTTLMFLDFLKIKRAILSLFHNKMERAGRSSALAAYLDWISYQFGYLRINFYKFRRHTEPQSINTVLTVGSNSASRGREIIRSNGFFNHKASRREKKIEKVSEERS